MSAPQSPSILFTTTTAATSFSLDTADDGNAAGSAEQQRRTPKRKADIDIDDLANYLPSDKRAKMAKTFGNVKGRFLSYEDGQGNDIIEVEEDSGDAKTAHYDSDSDILREMEVAEHAERAQKQRQLELQRQKSSQKDEGPAPDDWQNRQLLARVRARYETNEEEEEEAVEDEVIDDSPVLQRRRKPIINHQKQKEEAAAAREAEEAALMASPPADCSLLKKSNKLMVKIKDRYGQEVRARVRKTDALAKLFDHFKSTAAEKSWLPKKTTKCKFIFDGEEVGEGTTPEDLDMEDDDVIEVHYK